MFKEDGDEEREICPPLKAAIDRHVENGLVVADGERLRDGVPGGRQRVAQEKGSSCMRVRGVILAANNGGGCSRCAALSLCLRVCRY